MLSFHSDFFCVYQHEQEVGCHGVLFNTIAEPISTTLSPKALEKFNTITDLIFDEINATHITQSQMLAAQLKLLLITAVRNKDEELQEKHEEAQHLFLLHQLKQAIDEHFRKKHLISDYSQMLDISPKKLGKLTKQYWQRTASELISDRILVEAKRELYLTDSSVKAIA